MLFFIFILSVCEKIRMGSSNGFNKEDINALDIQVILSPIDVISLNFETSAPRNFGFIRFILFFLAINYLFYINEKNISIFNFCSSIILLLSNILVSGKTILVLSLSQIKLPKSSFGLK